MKPLRLNSRVPFHVPRAIAESLILQAMLGERASRISSAPSRSTARAQAAAAAAAHRTIACLTSTQRIRKWYILTRKLQLILDAFHYKTCCIQAIGERPYKTIFGELRTKELMMNKESEMTVTRLMNGEIMGKELTRSKTEKMTEGGRTDPVLCQHPPVKIMKGANRHAKWFTCLDCTTRWERIPLPDQSGPPMPQDLMLFGSHAMETNHQVLHHHMSYTNWCVKTVEESETGQQYPPCSHQLSRFVQFTRLVTAEHIPLPPSPEEEFQDIAPAWMNVDNPEDIDERNW